MGVSIRMGDADMFDKLVWLGLALGSLGCQSSFAAEGEPLPRPLGGKPAAAEADGETAELIGRG